MKRLYVLWAVPVLVLSGALAGEPPPPKAKEQGGEAGGVAILRRVDAVDLAQPVPVSLSSLEGVKLAFQARGSANACFTLHDEAAKKDLRPGRGVWKLTGNCPHVPGYQWGGGGWAPCLYRMDLFGQDSMIWHKMGKPPEGDFTRLDFARLSSPRERLQVRTLVPYRGDDTTAPEAPAGLAVRAGEDGFHLSWQPAGGNVGVAWYVVSSAAGEGKFTKIAQTAELEYTDRPPAAGTYRYRVLPADYERNLSTWSEVASVRVEKGFGQSEQRSVAKDSLWYAEHIRSVHDAGVGKVKRGTILHHGDCIHYLDRTRNLVASLEGLLTHGCVNWSTVYTIKPGNPSDRLLKELPKELELKPEFCVISAGLEDLHPKPWPEDARVAPEDRRKAVENVLAMVRMCEEQGTVAIVATLTPFGHAAPKGSPDERLSDELARMCEENKIPVARVFDLFRKAQEAGEDYTKLMADIGTTDVRGNAMWPRGYEYDPYTPSFELGITKRFIVVKETLDQVLFTLLDRPE